MCIFVRDFVREFLFSYISKKFLQHCRSLNLYQLCTLLIEMHFIILFSKYSTILVMFSKELVTTF